MSYSKKLMLSKFKFLTENHLHQQFLVRLKLKQHLIVQI